MSAALIITLRETLEAALVVGIILAYLNKTQNFSHKKYVWHGLLLGIIGSILCAFLFNSLAGGFEGTAEQIYEGITMWIAVALLTWMIVWMIQQRRNLKDNIEKKMATHIEGDKPWGIFLLTLISVMREGIETVIFLQAASLQNTNENNVLLGAITGMAIAILLAFGIFKGFMKVSLRKFFTATGIILIMFAAGLFAHGIHEFEEAGVIPIVIEHIWDINPPMNADDTYPLFHEKGSIGSIAVSLFGYNGNPSLVETIGYLSYLIIIGLTWRRTEKAN